MPGTARSGFFGQVGAAVRDRFPIFRDKIYVNSCSQGALSDAVRAAYEEYLDGWDENGAEWEHWVERSEAARTAFAGLLGAAPDDVAIQTSVSAAVSGLISALQFRGERNRIVISENEFPTIGQIAHAQELRGAEVVHVEPRPGGATQRRSTSGPRSSRRPSSPTGPAPCTTSRRSTGSPASTGR